MLAPANSSSIFHLMNGLLDANVNNLRGPNKKKERFCVLCIESRYAVPAVLVGRNIFFEAECVFSYRI